MNWTRVGIAGVVAGLVRNMVDFVMHQFIMGNTYTTYTDVFDQEPANPIWFFVIAICVGVAAAILYAKSVTCWGGGWKGGATFGFWLGVVFFFWPFYSPLVIEGFPYFLAWCWGGIYLIGFIILGAVIGAVYKS